MEGWSPGLGLDGGRQMADAFDGEVATGTAVKAVGDREVDAPALIIKHQLLFEPDLAREYRVSGTYPALPTLIAIG